MISLFVNCRLLQCGEGLDKQRVHRQHQRTNWTQQTQPTIFLAIQPANHIAEPTKLVTIRSNKNSIAAGKFFLGRVENDNSQRLEFSFFSSFSERSLAERVWTKTEYDLNN